MLVQTFIKVANYQHIMPTRYTLDVDLKSIVTQEALENSSKRTEARKVRFKCSICAAQALCAALHATAQHLVTWAVSTTHFFACCCPFIHELGQVTWCFEAIHCKGMFVKCPQSRCCGDMPYLFDSDMLA